MYCSFTTFCARFANFRNSSNEFRYIILLQARFSGGRFRWDPIQLKIFFLQRNDTLINIIIFECRQRWIQYPWPHTRNYNNWICPNLFIVHSDTSDHNPNSIKPLQMGQRETDGKILWRWPGSVLQGSTCHQPIQQTKCNHSTEGQEIGHRRMRNLFFIFPAKCKYAQLRWPQSIDWH